MKILIAVPSHRNPHPAMADSLQRVMASTRQQVRIAIHRNESMICRARNVLTHAFMQSDMDLLYFWDDDIACDDPMFIDKLVDVQNDTGGIVGALYSTRGANGHCAARVIEGTKPDGPVWPVRYLAGGSMLIDRRTIMAMTKRNGHLTYEARSNEGITGTICALFQPMIHKGEYLSEDWSFCQRALRAGIGIYADLDIKLQHWGDAPYMLSDPREVLK